MKKYIIVVTVVCSIGLCWLVARRQHAIYVEGQTHLQKQTNDLEGVRAEFNRVIAQTNPVTAVRPSDNSKELADLRAKAEAMMKQTNELGILLAKKREATKQSATEDGTLLATLPDDPKVKIQLAQQVMTLSTAFLFYADEHSNQAPPDMDSLRPYFKGLAEQTPPDLGSFEMIYHGSLDRLEGIPNGIVAVFRSRQSWQSANGKLGRVYGFTDGHALQLGSDDNFQSFEAQHVIPDAPVGQ